MGFAIEVLVKSVVLGFAVYGIGLAEWTYLTRHATNL